MCVSRSLVCVCACVCLRESVRDVGRDLGTQQVPVFLAALVPSVQDLGGEEGE